MDLGGVVIIVRDFGGTKRLASVVNLIFSMSRPKAIVYSGLISSPVGGKGVMFGDWMIMPIRVSLMTKVPLRLGVQGGILTAPRD